MVTNMNIADKVSVIDNNENRMKVANAIVANIFDRYNLSEDLLVRGWLVDCIIKDTLTDIICNEQKVYILELAEKCAADIAFIKHDSIEKDNFLTIARGFGDVGAFIEKVIADFNLDIDTLVVSACQTASVIGYEDTLIIDDTMYVYDNGSEDKILVKVDFTIGHHPNYTTANLRRRIAKRLHHKWETDIKAIDITQNEDSAFSVKAVFFAPKTDEEPIDKMINYRFGSTSGKPWYRCFVERVAIEK